ncbi:hypothetical protein B9Z55_028789 [Caenorhabditis nigoni]|nr:hypothetical protein B9Z55_028789 [Caenorhabditis nigoni]
MDCRILDQGTLENAEHLIVRSEMFRHDMNFSNLLMKISNQKVQINRISLNTVADSMDTWLEHGRPVGTSWLFQIRQVAGEEPSRYIQILRRNAQVIEWDRRSIKVSMGQSSIISVSYGDSIFHDNGYRREIWIVKMEVLHR